MDLTSAALEAQLNKVRSLESKLTFRIAVLAKLLDHEGQAMLEDTPLNLTAYRILHTVETFGAITVSDLSRVNVIDRAQVSRTAVELEKLGFVAFRPDPTSKRKKLVVPTEAGVEILSNIAPRFAARRRELQDCLLYTSPSPRDA